MTLTTTAPRRLERPAMTATAVYVGPGSDYRAPFLEGRWYVRVNGRPALTIFPNLHPGAARQVRDANHAVDLYREWLSGQPALVARARNLAGFDLACSCPVGFPCHADVLLELANGARDD